MVMMIKDHYDDNDEEEADDDGQDQDDEVEPGNVVYEGGFQAVNHC